MEKVSILAITKDGVRTGLDILGAFPRWELYAPGKFADTYGNDARVNWYTEQTSVVISKLFAQGDGLVCLFSLGATIRLVAPHIKDKKTDPAVIVIDEMRNFVISVLSGHIGGANRLTRDIAGRLGARPVITTAADVKGTISVDMIGRDYNWVIEDDSDVTAVSAHMVNEERVGVYQDAGRTDWWRGGGIGGGLPANVVTYDTLDALYRSDAKAHLIISDKADILSAPASRVIYRPPTLVVGVGVHHDTASDTIINGIMEVLKAHGLSARCVARLTSIKKPSDVPGLAEAAGILQVPLDLYDRDDLAGVAVPNPSDTVRAYEGTPSVSEAACIKAGGGPDSCSIIVQKQKFPPDLTVAVSRMSEA
ncbi:MAG: cobalamin biosynthesis protein [Nitrosopumilaceae archaeon]|nr:cobalamin biosynthesis protein [Nitrosopumilaceae archaeon]